MIIITILAYILLLVLVILWSYLRVNVKNSVVQQLKWLHPHNKLINFSKWILIISAFALTYVVFGVWYSLIIPLVVLFLRQKIGYFFFNQAAKKLVAQLKKDPKIHLYGTKLDAKELRTIAELQIRERMR